MRPERVISNQAYTSESTFAPLQGSRIGECLVRWRRALSIPYSVRSPFVQGILLRIEVVSIVPGLVRLGAFRSSRLVGWGLVFIESRIGLRSGIGPRREKGWRRSACIFIVLEVFGPVIAFGLGIEGQFLKGKAPMGQRR
jgi:hypothetical protein